jgi:hypothetical protein
LGKHRKKLPIEPARENSLRAVAHKRPLRSVAQCCNSFAEEKILPIYEKHCPNDGRARLALAIAKEVLCGSISLEEAKGRKKAALGPVARELEGNPAAQCAARAIIDLSFASLYSLDSAVRFLEYASAAVAYDEAGLKETGSRYAAIAERVAEEYEAALAGLS